MEWNEMIDSTIKKVSRVVLSYTRTTRTEEEKEREGHDQNGGLEQWGKGGFLAAKFKTRKSEKDSRIEPVKNHCYLLVTE